MTCAGLSKGPFFGARDLQTFLLFLAITIHYAERQNVSVSLVAMTNAATTNPNFHEFDWDEKERSYVISSFFWSYSITQFLGGYMARKLGAKLTLLIATVGSSILSLMIPFCIPAGEWQAYCGIRVGQGLFQGMIFPCVHAHVAKWSPIEERSRLGGLCYTGIECGTILGMALTGIIASSSLGWPGISYVFGGMGIILSVCLLILVENSPKVARFITAEEREYILTSQSKLHGEVETPIPWKALFTSVPFLSLLTIRICEAWGFTTMLAEIPAYLHGVLKMNIRNNALFSALPYMAMLICAFIFLVITDVVLKKKWATLSVVRKTVSTIAMWIPAAMFIGIGFLDGNQKALAITLMTLNVGLNGGATIGSSLNTIDLSPNHAGILMGLVNSIANFASILTPLAVGIIVYDETQRTQWQIVFIIAAVLFFVGNLQFICFGSTNRQPWDQEDFLLNSDKERNLNAMHSMTERKENSGENVAI